MTTLMISAVLFAVIASNTVCANAQANAPPEITKTFSQEGTLIQLIELQDDAGYKYLGVLQFGEYFVITWLHRKEGKYHFSNTDLLEIYIILDSKPVVIWSRPP